MVVRSTLFLLQTISELSDFSTPHLISKPFPTVDANEIISKSSFNMASATTRNISHHLKIVSHLEFTKILY